MRNEVALFAIRMLLFTSKMQKFDQFFSEVVFSALLFISDKGFSADHGWQKKFLADAKMNFDSKREKKCLCEQNAMN